MATYKIKEWDGTPVKGTFYEQDVQNVDVPDDALFRVEKVLQRRRHEVKVRWKGWPPNTTVGSRHVVWPRSNESSSGLDARPRGGPVGGPVWSYAECPAP